MIKKIDIQILKLAIVDSSNIYKYRYQVLTTRKEMGINKYKLLIVGALNSLT